MSEPESRHAICSHLRTKKMFYAADMLEVEAEMLTSSTYQSFWCEHTQTDTGPDDGYVEHRRCRPGRACYEEIGS